MANVRAAIMNAVLEADRLHQQFDTESRADSGDGRIDVYNMFLERGIPLMFQPLDGLLGAFIDDPRPGVVVTTQRQLPVQRFTAAHELGHAVLRHSPSLDNEDILARMPFVNSERYDIQEIQANAFASQLLMPQWLIAKHMERQAWRPADLTRPEVVYQLSLRLGASYSATCHALVRHKVVQESACEELLAIQPRAIKQRLAEPHEPPNWYGDVWRITERDDGLRLEGSRSDLIVLNLTEHSGSGYLWQFDDLSRIGLSVVWDARSEKGSSDSIGGSVVRTVVAETQDGAKGAIQLCEVRPWQANGDPLHSIDLDVDLSGPFGRGLLPAQRQAQLGAA